MGDIKETNRKQVAPLDLQKFLPEYSENQKWATHNMLRPLIFRNSFRNIQNIKNGLRIICCAPHSSKALLCTPSPQGEGLK